ncbi:MAG: ABC transporter permease [Candidatus Helarchaeota archaeon]
MTGSEPKEASFFVKARGALFFSGKAFSVSYNSSKLWQGYLIGFLSIFLLSFVLSTSTYPLFMQIFPHFVLSFNIFGITIWITFSPAFLMVALIVLSGSWFGISFIASYFKKLKMLRVVSALGFALTPLLLLLFYLLNKFILQSFKYEIGPFLIGLGIGWSLISGLIGFTSLMGINIGGLFNYSIKSVIYRKKRTYGAILGITVAIGLIVIPIPIVRGYYSQLNNLAGPQQYSQYILALESGKESYYDSFIAESIIPSFNHTNIACISPETYISVNISKDECKSNVNIRGINYSIFKNFRSGFQSQITPTESFTDGKIIIGNLLASMLNISYPTLPINVIITRNFKQYNVTIIGILISSIQYDMELFATINFTRRLESSLLEKFSLIELKLKDPSLVDTTIQTLENNLPEIDIQRENQLADFVAGIISRTIQSIWLLSIVVYVAMGFGMFHIMQTIIRENEREIAILKSVGADRFQIIRIFLYQAIILSLIGGVLGVLSGVFLSYGASFIVSQITSIVVRPVFDIFVIGFAIGLGIITGLLGSLYPAYKASKKRVGEIIK